MPPLPEVGWISGQEWPGKIKWELKPQQLRATTSDVGVTREIEEDLHEEGYATRPCSQPTGLRHRIVEVRVGTRQRTDQQTPSFLLDQTERE